MKLLAKAINVIVWILILSIPIGGLILGILEIIKDPIQFLTKAFNTIVVCFFLLVFFGLLGLVMKWSEKVIKK
ncbi:hypothetical protein V2605_03545 [Tenacibaculum maritimum]|uniref:hypothetical protein n=1 Tax=Tenacibaculum maritimum TaxID=107401 RepID=UPI001330C63C|nr:hypothetical protein [Tenacibaculum maritimum]